MFTKSFWYLPYYLEAGLSATCKLRAQHAFEEAQHFLIVANVKHKDASLFIEMRCRHPADHGRANGASIRIDQDGIAFHRFRRVVFEYLHTLAIQIDRRPHD